MGGTVRSSRLLFEERRVQAIRAPAVPPARLRRRGGEVHRVRRRQSPSIPPDREPPSPLPSPDALSPPLALSSPPLPEAEPPALLPQLRKPVAPPEPLPPWPVLLPPPVTLLPLDRLSPPVALWPPVRLPPPPKRPRPAPLPPPVRLPLSRGPLPGMYALVPGVSLRLPVPPWAPAPPVLVSAWPGAGPGPAPAFPPSAVGIVAVGGPPSSPATIGASATSASSTVGPRRCSQPLQRQGAEARPPSSAARLRRVIFCLTVLRIPTP